MEVKGEFACVRYLLCIVIEIYSEVFDYCPSVRGHFLSFTSRLWWNRSWQQKTEYIFVENSVVVPIPHTHTYTCQSIFSHVTLEPIPLMTQHWWIGSLLALCLLCHCVCIACRFSSPSHCYFQLPLLFHFCNASFGMEAFDSMVLTDARLIARLAAGTQIIIPDQSTAVDWSASCLMQVSSQNLGPCKWYINCMTLCQLS